MIHPSLPMLVILGLTAFAQDWRSVAQQAQRDHDFERAAAAYSELLATDPGNAKLLSNLGMMLHLAGKPKQALPPLLKALKSSPDMVAANLFAGLSLLNLSRAQEALPYLARALKGDPKGALPLLGLAKAHFALGHFRPANDYFELASERDPSNGEIWAGLGATYGEMAKAVTAQLWKTNPDLVVIDRVLSAAGNPSTRAEMVATEHALKQRPGDPVLLVRLKRACLSLSLSSLRRAIELDSNSYENHSYFAASLALADRHSEAVVEYEKALRLRPDSAPACLALGVALWKQGKGEEALTPLKKSLRLDPNVALTNAVLGDLLVAGGEADQSVSYLRQALRLDPELAPAHATLAKAYRAQNRLDLAIEEIQKALPYDWDGSYYYIESQIYREMGRSEESAAALKRFFVRSTLQQGEAAH
jgi:tetratricopeptide (TPR) repeat protein